MRTINSYIDEIKLRINRLGVINQFSDEDISNIINVHRNNVFRITKDLYPERYSKIVDIPLNSTMLERSGDIITKKIIAGAYTTYTYRCLKIPLPMDFIEPYVCILRYTYKEGLEDAVYNNECRLSDRREQLNLVVHNFNYPRLTDPMYLVETKILDNVSIINYSLQDFAMNTYNSPSALLLYGLDLPNNKTIFDDDKYTNIMIELWYVAALSQLENTVNRFANANTGNPVIPVKDEELSIPSEFDELLILMSSADILLRQQELDRFKLIEADRIDYIKNLKAMHEAKKQKKILLPSKEPLEKL